MHIKNTFLLIASLLISIVLFSQNTYKIPGENWSINVDIKGFTIEKEILSADSTMFQLSARNNKLNINLSLFIEKVDSDGDKNECRKFYWGKAEKSPLAKENIRQYETDNLAIVEHDTKEYNGQIVDFHSVNAYLAKNGYWVDVHMSKVGYSKKDKKQFEKILDSISIVID